MIAETVLPASVQPISNEDNLAIGVGGRLSERVKVFLPFVAIPQVMQATSFRWNGDTFKWGSDSFEWGGDFDQFLQETLQAAFEDRAPDRVRLSDGREFSVEESRTWLRGHTRATLLRET